ncbi:hypothetical protein POM88_040995 [Heracleum sosnowskyi]|uniref:HMG box domain-containing protein n=1 Tax=Heracleum sosnowskyi TaxID=360622 RepID=A0AAD8MAA1_9APIA|nr:hypothetical protein POM88_040995 [Heracleum sosnowskyi]
MWTEVKKESPDAEFKEISTMLASKWKTVTAEEKKPYEEKYQAEKEAYLKIVGAEKCENEAMKLLEEEQKQRTSMELLEQYMQFKEETENDKKQKTKKEKDPLKPKHPVTTFFFVTGPRSPSSSKKQELFNMFLTASRSVKNKDKQLRNDGDKENMPPLSPSVIQSPFFSNVSLRGDYKENCTPLSTTDIVSTFASNVSNPGSVKRQYKPRTNALISEYVLNKNPNSLLCHDKEVTNIEAEPPPKRKYKPRQKKDSSCDQEVRAQVKRKYTPRAKVVQTDGFPASSDCRTPLGNMTNVLNSDSHNHIPSFSSTITNNEDVVVTTSKRINQTKFSFPESSRSLFSDKNHRGNLNESEIDYEVIEHSVILNEESDEELFVEDECDLADDMNSDFLDDGLESNVHHIPEEYATLGAPTCICLYCGAYMWKEERVNKNVIHGTPMFSLCCGRGQICLPKALPAPTYLQNLYNDMILRRKVILEFVLD